ncbi:translocation/assembly module TamB domain-containing protein [Donghicola mangrovi]|uniref:Translocation and assembly module TamB C-terminal domain-containing protein n=1 Tax=Donghicola mangrovi TaxID=2729614 RepID=A0A850Q693_9RHOB|nr:translocation/assembly module TamB domain-containing protein [Donghicola mangrovi]NVO22200.1 hypothetical protein [Donghicola mangrovi]
MKRIFAALVMLMLPLAAWAQDEDGQGYLERLLQDTLSGAGREVRIEGFSGALSSRATIDRLTIADDQGVWLDAQGLALDWSRAALLRGRIEVNELSADSISMPRKPVSNAVDVPAPEATAFTLPDLPVSVNVEKLEVAKASLGADVIGQDAVLSLSGSAQLANGAGTVALEAQRTDGPKGDFKVDLAYDPNANTAAILVAATEDAGGIVSKLSGIPRSPSVDLKIEGQGPADDLTVDVALRTDNALRLGGQVTLRGQALDVDLGGDLRPLVEPTYHALLGDDARLVASAAKADDGTLTLENLTVDARAANLQGSAVISPSGLPQSIDLQGELRAPDGQPLTLATDVTVGSVTIDIGHDAATAPDWQGQIVLRDLVQAAVTLPEATLKGRGQIVPADGDNPQNVTARFDFDTAGMQMADAALQGLLGPVVTGGVTLHAVDGQPLDLSELAIKALAFTANGSATIDGLESGYDTKLDLKVVADDLAKARDLSGMDLNGAAEFAVAGQVVPLSGAFDLRVSGDTKGLQIGQQMIDGLIGGDGTVSVVARRDETGVTVDELLMNTGGARVQANGTIGSAETNFEFNTFVKDFSLLGQGGAGRAALDGQIALAGATLRQLSVNGVLSGPEGLVIPLGQDQLAMSGGRIDLSAGNGRWSVNTDLTGVKHPQGAVAEALIKGAGSYSQGEGGVIEALRGSVEAALAGAKPAGAALAQALGQDVTVQTTFEYTDGAPLVLDPLRVQGADYGANGTVSVDVDTQVATVDLTANVGNAARFSALAGRDLGGKAQLDVTGTVSATTADLVITGNGSGIDLGDPHINGVLGGQFSLDTHVLRDGATLTLERLALNGGNLSLSASGSVSDTGKSLQAEARVPEVGRLVAELSGPVTITAKVGGDAEMTTVDAALTGPAGMTANVGGSIAANGTLNLTATGDVPLTLANPMIAPRQVSGDARFDLAVRGPAGLDAVSGTVTLSDGMFSEPSSGISLNAIGGTATIGGNQVRLDMRASGSQGGDISVTGTVGLTGAFDVNADVVITDLTLNDPGLYEATLGGSLNFNGPALNGGRLKGEIVLSEAELRIPETGAGSAGAIPDITHQGAAAKVLQTLDRAGLSATAEPEAANESSGVAIPLDLTIRAPARIFVRGRGLDAELGGQIRLRGTTADIIPIGRFDLVRGRLLLLGQRFDFDEGYISMEGALVPVIRLVVETQQGDVLTYIIVEGDAMSPEVTFSSSPELPEDEVLAQLLFGRDMSRLSAFQALQLANAVAVLAGKGGEGIVSKLRQGFDLDDLDVTTDDQGNAALRAGKYISDSVYTDVTVGAAGKTELNLNIDISPSVTARGGVNDEGQSSLGIFFERDY